MQATEEQQLIKDLKFFFDYAALLLSGKVLTIGNCDYLEKIGNKLSAKLKSQTSLEIKELHRLNVKMQQEIAHVRVEYTLQQNLLDVTTNCQDQTKLSQMKESLRKNFIVEFTSIAELDDRVDDLPHASINRIKPQSFNSQKHSFNSQKQLFNSQKQEEEKKGADEFKPTAQRETKSKLRNWREKQKTASGNASASSLASEEEKKEPRPKREGYVNSQSRINIGGVAFTETRTGKGRSTSREFSIGNKVIEGKHPELKSVAKRLVHSRSSSNLSHIDQLKKCDKSVNKKLGGMGFGK